MIVFDCECTWRFIVGKKQVYGPIYLHDLPGHFKDNGSGSGCYTRGRMMTREQFEDDYADCAGRFARQQNPGPHDLCVPGQPCRVRGG